MDREDIEFTGELGTTLRGWFYPAQNAAGPAPVIVDGARDLRRQRDGPRRIR